MGTLAATTTTSHGSARTRPTRSAKPPAPPRKLGLRSYADTHHDSPRRIARAAGTGLGSGAKWVRARSPKRASRGWQLAVPVDVVPVRVNDERCVIPGVVMRAKTRRAVVAAAGFDSGAVELVDGGSVGSGEGHMNGSSRGFPFLDPEISTALDCEPRPPRALHYLHSERLEGLLVEGAAASRVTYSQGQVVDEGKRHGQRHALYLRARPPGNIPEHWGTSPHRHASSLRRSRKALRAAAEAVDDERPVAATQKQDGWVLITFLNRSASRATTRS